MNTVSHGGQKKGIGASGAGLTVRSHSVGAGNKFVLQEPDIFIVFVFVHLGVLSACMSVHYTCTSLLLDTRRGL